MLPKSLLMVNKKKGSVIPKYILDPDEINEANKLIDVLITIYRESLGKSKNYIKKKVESLEKEIDIEPEFERSNNNFNDSEDIDEENLENDGDSNVSESDLGDDIESELEYDLEDELGDFSEESTEYDSESKEKQENNQEEKNIKSGNSINNSVFKSDRYKIIRSLMLLIERKCEFKCPVDLPLENIRAFIFGKGPVFEKFQRKDLFKKTAEQFGSDPKIIESNLYSDLPDENILINFPEFSPKLLIYNFNFSQTQTLLLSALKISVEVDDGYKNLFWTIKRLGLMYEIDGNQIIITGPLSNFKNSRRYGSAFAKLLPIIVQAPKWRINAEISMSYGSSEKIFQFDLSSEDKILQNVVGDFIEHSDKGSEKNEVIFDSSVEEKFYKDFKAAQIGWDVKFEPAFIKCGDRVTIPDFGFTKYGTTIYMEIVGFWTPDYLSRKIEKLNNAETPIIAAVNNKLNCTSDSFMGTVIFYDKFLDPYPIVEILKTHEERIISEQLKKIDMNSLKIPYEIVPLKEIASNLGIDSEIFRRLELPKYVISEDLVISRDFLDSVKPHLRDKMPYYEAKNFFDEKKIPMSVLDYLGFKVKWKGLNPVYLIQIN